METPRPVPGAPDELDPESGAARRGLDGVRTALGAVLGTWAATFLLLGWRRHDRFATFSFDLGIYDQGIWLLSRWRDPFVTVRGLELLGHHMNATLLLLVPAYWFGAGPQFLQVVQVGALIAGAVAAYLLARDRLGDRWLGVGMATVVLLHPSWQWQAWEGFHPDVLAIPMLLFAYWAARVGRWRTFVVFAALAALCKEDAALAVVVLGILVAVRGRRRLGLIVAAGALAWFVLATRVLIPWINGANAPFYDYFFSDFGNSPGEILRRAFGEPDRTLRIVTGPDRRQYAWQMLAPVGLLPLAALPTLALAAPALGVNALSSFPYTREITYHYSAIVLAGIAAATVEAVAFLGRTMAWRRVLVGFLLVTSAWSTVAWGPSPVGRAYRDGWWPLSIDDERQAARREAVRMVPDDASVSAIYSLVPHLTHRERIYDFPVPWENLNWGVRGEGLHDPAGVEWLVIDRNLVGPRDQALLDRLLAEEFALRYERAGIVVAQRVATRRDTEPTTPSTSSGARLTPG